MTLDDALATAFSRTSLLVVDHKPLFRDMVRATFLTKVKGVREAADIDKALDILGRAGAGIGCVICDWDMVPVGGLELLRMIRAGTVAGCSPRTPVVILTTRSDPEAVRAAMELDVNAFLVGPVSLEKLIETVGEALTRGWILQQPSHYASVHGIVPRPPGLEKMPLDKVPLRKAPRLSPRRRSPFLGTKQGAKPFGRRDTGSAQTQLRNVRMCILDDVNPGVILARDLKDRDGRVLAPRGTELKPAVLEQLRNVGYALSDSYCVWVGDQ